MKKNEKGKKGSGYADIIQGNLELFRREQKESVTPWFEKYPAPLEAATKLGKIIVPNKGIRKQAEEMGLNPKWDKKESYGPFQPRWDWLKKNAWEPYLRFIEDNPKRAMEAIERAIKGENER